MGTFAYMREYVSPAHGFAMADNGAQEIEVIDAPGGDAGWAYLPVRPAE